MGVACEVGGVRSLIKKYNQHDVKAVRLKAC